MASPRPPWLKPLLPDPIQSQNDSKQGESDDSTSNKPRKVEKSCADIAHDLRPVAWSRFVAEVAGAITAVDWRGRSQIGKGSVDEESREHLCDMESGWDAGRDGMRCQAWLLEFLYQEGFLLGASDHRC